MISSWHAPTEGNIYGIEIRDTYDTETFMVWRYGIAIRYTYTHTHIYIYIYYKYIYLCNKYIYVITIITYLGGLSGYSEGNFNFP